MVGVLSVERDTQLIATTSLPGFVGGSQWGGGFYGYRLKFLAPLRLSVNFF